MKIWQEQKEQAKKKEQDTVCRSNAKSGAMMVKL